MTPPTSPKMYVVQKKVLACSAQEAMAKAESLPIDSVFPDTTPAEAARVDAIGFKIVPVPE